MYSILSEMVDSTLTGNREKTFQLHEYFKRIFDDLEKTASQETFKEYDNCRQSCLGVFLIPHRKQELLADIIMRFSRITKP